MVLGSYEYIPGPMSGETVSEYSSRVLCTYTWALCQVGRSKSIVLGSDVYIPGSMSGGKEQNIVLGSIVYIKCPMSGGIDPRE